MEFLERTAQATRRELKTMKVARPPGLAMPSNRKGAPDVVRVVPDMERERLEFVASSLERYLASEKLD